MSTAIIGIDMRNYRNLSFILLGIIALPIISYFLLLLSIVITVKVKCSKIYKMIDTVPQYQIVSTWRVSKGATLEGTCSPDIYFYSQEKEDKIFLFYKNYFIEHGWKVYSEQNLHSGGESSTIVGTILSLNNDHYTLSLSSRRNRDNSENKNRWNYVIRMHYINDTYPRPPM